MPQHADASVERDPLLEFSNEIGITPTIDPEPSAVVQPIPHTVVAQTAAQPIASLPSVDTLVVRVDLLERKLASLELQVETLVATLGDMKGSANLDGSNGPAGDVRRAWWKRLIAPPTK